MQFKHIETDHGTKRKMKLMNIIDYNGKSLHLSVVNAYQPIARVELTERNISTENRTLLCWINLNQSRINTIILFNEVSLYSAVLLQKT